MHFSIYAYATAAACLAVTASSAMAGETRVSCASLPQVVLEHAQKEAPGAKVLACIRDFDKGKITYEVESMRDDKSRDMTFGADGSLMEVEQEVSPESLPLPVSSAIQQAGRGGKVGKIECVTRGGVVTAYETTITKHGFRHEVAFGSDGMRRPAD